MLPYHSRPPPTSSRNNKKDKNKTANVSSTSTTRYDYDDDDDDDAFLFRNNNNNNNGGPIQHAALRDLRELRQDFLLFLNSNDGNDDDDNDDDDDFSAAAATTATDKKHHHVARPVGVAFGVFREVFRSAKVAALHSRFISANRTCDVNAHAQLLYAACFQLLHEPFQQQQQAHENDNEALQRGDDDQQQTDDDDHGDDSSVCRKSTLLLEQHAIYAIFSLFALYETNPLPLAPSSITTTATNYTQKQTDVMSTLPCGLRDRENPKLVYRRQYRQGIRINRQGYARLLQVQELARARIAACCYQQQQEQIVRTQISEHGQSTSSSSSRTPRTCHCGAATDVLFVLNRLWSKLILSEYTGPRGLEGLAGHEDYPFPPNMQDFDLANASTKSRTATAGTKETGATAVAAATTNDTAKLLQEIMTSSHQHASNDDDDTTTGSSTALLFSDSLQSHLQTYLSARRAIRLPIFNNNAKSNTTTGAAAAVVTQSRLVQERIRQALQPMFDQGKQQRTDPFLQIVNASAMTMQHQAKRAGETSFADAIIVCDDPSKHNNDDDDNDANNPRALEAVQGHEPSGNNNGDTTTDSTCRQHKDAEESYELIIPSNLPASLFESIQAAVRTLVDRDKDSFLILQQQQRQTATAGVASDGVEDDGSAATVDDDDDDGGGGGAGHEALAALIAQASARSAGPMKNTRVTFLDTSTRGTQEDEGRTRKRQSGGRLSQKDDDDDISESSSTVGQRALEDLLMTAMVMGESAAPEEQKKKQQPTKPRKRARKGGAINEPRKRTHKNTGVDMEQEDSVDEDSAEDSEEEEDEDEFVGGEGNAALELLIGRAMM